MNENHGAYNEGNCNPESYGSDRDEIYSFIIHRQSKLSQCFIDLGDHFVTNFEFLQMLIDNETIL